MFVNKSVHIRGNGDSKITKNEAKHAVIYFFFMQNCVQAEF